VQDLVVLLGAASLVATVFHVIRLPPLVAYFIAGAMIGPSGLALIGSPPKISILTEGAALFLMFTLGLEFAPKEILGFRKPIFVLGLGQVLATVFIFTLLFRGVLTFPMPKAIYWSFIVALSSTAVVMKMLADHRDFESPHGRAAFSILLAQDMAVIPMILVIPLLSQTTTAITLQGQEIWDSLFPVALLTAAAGGGLYAFHRWILPMVTHSVAATRNREVFFFFIVSLVAMFSAGFHSVGLSFSLGAFVAGVFLAGSDFGRQAMAEFTPLRNVFLGVFFVSVGMLLDLSFLFQNLHSVLIIGSIVLSLKALVLFMVVWWSGNSGSVSRTVALFLFQMGEFSFILADQGLRLGLASQKETQIFMAIAIISLATTPFVYRILPWLTNARFFRTFDNARARRLRDRLWKNLGSAVDITALNLETKHHQADVVIVGFGVAGQALAKSLRLLNVSYAVIESNAQTVRKWAHLEPIVYGDATAEEILLSAGLADCRLCVALTSGLSTLEPVYHAIRRLRPEVPVVARTNYLLDVDRFPKNFQTRFVVSEFETSLEATVQALESLQIPRIEIENLVQNLRREYSLTQA
jgi:monovalent cation:H+ antiporter-2, CPA2 family